MKVLVLYNELDDNPTADQQDVLTQRDAVLDALRSSGYETAEFGCTLDLNKVRRRLLVQPPDVVFNLVESLANTDRLAPLIPLLLGAMQIPYTGASAAAMLAVANKLDAKKAIRRAGLPTPDWIVPDAPTAPFQRTADSSWIIKPLWEHASAGMDDDSVVASPDAEELLLRLSARQNSTGRPHFAEQYVDGREFNISLLDGEVLQPAEIDFSAFPINKPRIVGQRAKWDADSFEYQQTPRRFDFPASDAGLLRSLIDLCRRCWDLFQLSGFARVDFRVDRDGSPWILEVNVNPCLSPDAGFAAALSEADIDYCDAIRRVVMDATGTVVESVPTAPQR